MLAKLFSKRGLTDRYWEKLWSSLCHQCSTYPASFAAVPHLVVAADGLSVKQRLNAMLLAAGILACTLNDKDGRIGDRVPEFLRSSLRKAINDGQAVIAKMLNDVRRSNVETMHFLAIVAAFDSRPEVWGLLQTVCSDFCCPVCGEDIVDPYTSLSGL